MAFIGNTNTTQGFVPAVDFFSGNGSTTAFTLSRPVASVAQVQANISNVPQNPGSAYTVSGNTITFTSAPPSGTNNIYVYYTSPITQVIAPGQGTVTSESFGTIVNFTTTGNTVLGDASTDTLNVGNGGLVKDASGNVGIGVTPNAWDTSIFTTMQIRYASFFSGVTSPGDTWVGQNLYYGSGAYRYIANGYSSYYRQSQSQHQWGVAASGTAGNAITFTQAMTLDASGNLGIGTSSPSTKLHLYGASDQRIRFENTGWTKAYQIGNDQNALSFYDVTAAAERMRIDTSGNLLVGTTTSGGRLTVGTTTGATNFTMSTGSGITNQVNGINFYENNGGAPTAYISAFNSAYGSGVNNALQAIAGGSGGVRLLSGATAWSAISDENLKNVTGTYTTPLADIAQIQAVKFTWKSDETNTPQVGVLAQSVQKVIPEAVVSGALSLEDKTEYLSVRYTEIIPLMIASIQELKSLVDTQANTIQTLTDRITALENK